MIGSRMDQCGRRARRPPYRQECTRGRMGLWRQCSRRNLDGAGIFTAAFWTNRTPSYWFHSFQCRFGCAASPLTLYAATKHASLGLAEGLRAEALAENVPMTILCPGLLNTDIWDAARARPEKIRRPQAHGSGDFRAVETGAKAGNNVATYCKEYCRGWRLSDLPAAGRSSRRYRRSVCCFAAVDYCAG